MFFCFRCNKSHICWIFLTPSLYRPAPSTIAPLASAPATPTENTLTIALIVAGGIIVFASIVICWFAFGRRRAEVSHSADDMILELRKALMSSSDSALKELGKLDDKIKQFMSDDRVCHEILKVVSEHITDLNPRIQVRGNTKAARCVHLTAFAARLVPLVI